MTSVYGRGVSGLLKRGWNEMPEVIGSSFMGLIGIGLAIAGLSVYYSNDRDNRKYKANYTVVRHDDPCVANIRKD